MSSMHGPCFFWLPFPPWESPNTLLPCAKNDDSLHLPLFSITKKQNLRKPYHKPTTLPKMNIAPARVSSPKGNDRLPTVGAKNHGAKILVSGEGVHGSRFLSNSITIFGGLHPGRLTWNIIIEVWNIIFLSSWVICMFHANLPGCNPKLGNIFAPSFVNLQKQWHFLSTRNTRQQSMLVVQKLRLQLDLDGWVENFGCHFMGTKWAKHLLI